MRVFEPTELLHLQVAGRDLTVDKAVRVFLLRTVQFLTILVHMLQHSAAVGGRQLEPNLWFRQG